MVDRYTMVVYPGVMDTTKKTKKSRKLAVLALVLFTTFGGPATRPVVTHSLERATRMAASK